MDFCSARGGTLVDESNPALQGFLSWELWRRHKVMFYLVDFLKNNPFINIFIKKGKKINKPDFPVSPEITRVE